jgi:hypothetical protein
VYDQFDVSLEDADLLGEVELVMTFIIAASESEGRLSTDRIDELLGLTPEPPVQDSSRRISVTGQGR